MISSGVLSLYALGRTTGVALSYGEGKPYAIPVFDGVAIRPAVTKNYQLTGKDLTKNMQKIIEEHNKF